MCTDQAKIDIMNDRLDEIPDTIKWFSAQRGPHRTAKQNAYLNKTVKSNKKRLAKINTRVQQCGHTEDVMKLSENLETYWLFRSARVVHKWPKKKPSKKKKKSSKKKKKKASKKKKKASKKKNQP